MTERTLSQAMPQRHIVSLGPEATVFEAACVMTRANCGSVLIVDSSAQLLGILTERDLMTRVMAKGLDPRHTATARVMTPHPRTVTADMLAVEVLEMINAARITSVFVLSDDGKPEGIVHIHDLLRIGVS